MSVGVPVIDTGRGRERQLGFDFAAWDFQAPEVTQANLEENGDILHGNRYAARPGETYAESSLRSAQSLAKAEVPHGGAAADHPRCGHHHGSYLHRCPGYTPPVSG